jgi:hypothetical protein
MTLLYRPHCGRQYYMEVSALMHRSSRLVALATCCLLWPALACASSLDGTLYAADFPGADMGAKVVAAISTCPHGCTVLLPQGTFDFSTPIVLTHGISLVGQGSGATLLNWVGSGSVVPITVHYAKRSRLRNFGVNRNYSTTTTPAIEVLGGWDTQIDDIWCTSNLGTWQEYVGFQGCLWITGTTQNSSCITRVSNSRFETYTGYAIKVDHAIDVHLNNMYVASYPDNINVDGLIIDTDVGGMHIDQVSCSYGRHCLIVRNTMGGTNPLWLYFNEFEADTTSGGDAILFDKSLGSYQVMADFVNSWAGGAGTSDNPNGAVLNGGANGIRIDGGSRITWEGRIRRNASNGILIDSTTSSFINIHDSSIYSNNVANSPDTHGIYITGAAPHISIIGNDITNSLDYGYQRYGVKVARVRADQLRVLNNDLNNNLAGPYSSANLGASMVSGNMPVSTGGQISSSGR